jgi:ribose transport system substrate-binding protein
MNFRTFAILLAAGAPLVSFAQPQKSYTIGLVAKSQGNPVFQAARVGAEQAAADLGQKHGIKIKIDWRTPNEEDAQRQAEAIEQLVLAGASGIACRHL